MEKELLADYEKIHILEEEIGRNVAELSLAIPKMKELVEEMKGLIGESESETMRWMKKGLSWVSEKLEDGEKNFADFSVHMSSMSSSMHGLGELCKLIKLISNL